MHTEDCQHTMGFTRLRAYRLRAYIGFFPARRTWHLTVLTKLNARTSAVTQHSAAFPTTRTRSRSMSMHSRAPREHLCESLVGKHHVITIDGPDSEIASVSLTRPISPGAVRRRHRHRRADPRRHSGLEVVRASRTDINPLKSVVTPFFKLFFATRR
jgi:hypothetical protein